MNKEIKADFKVEKIVEEVFYPHNIKYQKIKGLTKTNHEGTVAGNKFGEANISNEMIDENKYYPQNIFALTIPYNKEIKFRQMCKTKYSTWEREHLLVLANTSFFQFDEIPFAIINNDFFDIGEALPFPRQPDGIVIQGKHNFKTKSYGDNMSGNLGVDLDNNFVAFSLEESNSLFEELPEIDIAHTATLFYSTLPFKYLPISSFKINAVNTKPKKGEIALYFALPNLDHKVVPKEIVPAGKLYQVKEIILPNGENDFYGEGEMVDMHIFEKLNYQKAKTSYTLKENNFYIDSLSEEFDRFLEEARGNYHFDYKSQEFEPSLLMPYNLVMVQYKLKKEYRKFYSFFGFKGIVLDNGKFNNQMEGNFRIRHPRTIIGIKENKDVVLAVIDGRKPEEGSFGVNGAEMAEIMKYFGCFRAYNFDGGGSSAMFLENEEGELKLKNRPCEGSRAVINGLVVTNVIKKALK